MKDSVVELGYTVIGAVIVILLCLWTVLWFNNGRTSAGHDCELLNKFAVNGNVYNCQQIK